MSKFPELKPKIDPCEWSDSEKESCNAEAEYWMDKWYAYCHGELDA